MKPKIAVLGSYAQALVITVERIPVSGETLLGRDYRETYGGKGSDMAVQAARLGADVAFVGVVGNDHLGQGFIDLMEREGVDIRRLRTTDERSTGVGLIIKDTNGSNIIVVDMGANKLFGIQDVEKSADVLREAQVVLAQLEIPLATSLYGLGVAKAAHVTTVLNPAPAVDLTGTDLQDVDILTPNETEARVLLGLSPNDPTSNAEIASMILALGCRAVVMTLGDKGVAVYRLMDGHQTETLTEAWPVAVVDSNGAGDSFNAALCTGLAEGMELPAAVSFAAATAALCCTDWETVPSYRTRAQVDAFMNVAS